MFSLTISLKTNMNMSKFMVELEIRESFQYIRRDCVNQVENLDKWKVFIPECHGSGALGEVLTTPVIGHPQSATRNRPHKKLLLVLVVLTQNQKQMPV